MRNAAKMLTAEALRAGDREQYAVTRSLLTYVVELQYVGTVGHPRDWQVKHVITSPSGVVELHVWRHHELDDARKRWHTEVRRAKG